MGFGTWNVGSLYKSGSVTTVVRELERYKLDLLDMQEVRWDKRELRVQWIVFLSTEKENKITNKEHDIWYATK
jgi:exonuclease III